MPQPIIMEPRRVGGEWRLSLRTDDPKKLVKALVNAIHEVNLSGEEMRLELDNGQKAMLSPGSDLEPLTRLLESDDFQDAVIDALKHRSEK